MRFLRDILLVVLTASVTCSAIAVPLPRASSFSMDTLPGRIVQRAPTSEHIEKRQSPATLIRFAKTWFKIGKALFKDYKKVAQANDQPGAGFHRDFGDLVDTQLPDPPQPIDSLDDLLPDDLS